MLTEQALEYDPDGRHRKDPLPGEIADHEHRLHDELVEEIVSGDDEQLEQLPEGEIPTIAELERTLAAEVLACTEFPVLVGSGHHGRRRRPLADFICELGPSPADRPSKVTAGGTEVEVSADPSGEPLAYVFKTVSDQYVGQISLFKVVSGTLRNDTTSRGGDRHRRAYARPVPPAR